MKRRKRYLRTSTCRIVELLYLLSVISVATNRMIVFSSLRPFFASSSFVFELRRSKIASIEQKLYVFHLFIYDLINRLAYSNTLH